jgi:hypothetical protein
VDKPLLFTRGVEPQRDVPAWLRKRVSEVDARLSAQAMDRLQGPIAAWLRKLGPSKTLSERTYEHCVSPSPKATAAIRPCIHRKSQQATRPPQLRMMIGTDLQTLRLAIAKRRPQ